MNEMPAPPLAHVVSLVENGTRVIVDWRFLFRVYRERRIDLYLSICEFDTTITLPYWLGGPRYTWAASLYSNLSRIHNTSFSE